MSKGPKILFADIETAPIVAHVWQLWDQNVGINQIVSDWHLLSWAAKWQHESRVMYADQRYAKNIEDDSKLLKGIWSLLDQADIVVTQNGKAFDEKKLNARFILNGFQPPSSFKHIDTKVLAKRRFGFTSNSLEYMSKALKLSHQKLTHKKYPGFELWKACLAGEMAAWKEMEAYNRQDVLALEELYNKLIPWDSSINFNIYREGLDEVCKCGSTDFARNGYAYTATGKYQRYKCRNCGAETRDTDNLLTREKRDSLRRSTGK